MTDTINFFGTIDDDVIDFSQTPLFKSTYSVARAGKGNDSIALTNGKWAVGGSGNDTITSIGFGIFGILYDDSPNAVSIDATNGTVQDGFGTVDSIRGINAFFGSNFDDLIVGSAANEYLGSSIYAPAGNDTYIGGGGYDVVIYFSNSTDYQVNVNSATLSATVKYLKTGTSDYLKGISQIQFRDTSINLQIRAASHDAVYGSSSNDIFKAGSNPYFPGQGGDTISGMGGWDVVTYPLTGAEYEVKVDAATDSATVRWIKTGGTDTLIGISALEFANSTLTLAPRRTSPETVTGTPGNDVLTSSASKSNIPSGGDLFIGGGGCDIVRYADLTKNFKIAIDTTKNSTKVTWIDGSIDQLNQILRVQFSDGNIALDLSATQAAGETVLLLGTVLPGKLALDSSKQKLLGTVISFFDYGYTMPELAGALLRLDIWSILTGQNISTTSPYTARSLAEDTLIADYLLTNVNGATPNADTLKSAAEALHLESSQGAWLAQLALSSAGQAHIGLVGLAATGISYL